MNYWEKNKKALSVKRKKKWAEDPAFRKRQKERDQARRQKLRQEKLEGVLAGMKQRLIQSFDGSLSVPRLGIVSSETVGLTTTGLGYVLDRSRDTVQAWLAQGVLPGYSERWGSYRLFHRDYCNVIVEAFYEMLQENLRGNSRRFKEILTAKVQASKLEVLPNGSKEKEKEKEGCAEGRGQREG